MEEKLLRDLKISMEETDNLKTEWIYFDLIGILKRYTLDFDMSKESVIYACTIVMDLLRADEKLFEDYDLTIEPMKGEGISIEIDMGYDLELEIEVYEDYCNVAIYEDIEVLDKTSGIDHTEVVELAMSYMNKWN